VPNEVIPRTCEQRQPISVIVNGTSVPLRFRIGNRYAGGNLFHLYPAQQFSESNPALFPVRALLQRPRLFTSQSAHATGRATGHMYPSLHSEYAFPEGEACSRTRGVISLETSKCERSHLPTALLGQNVEAEN
jgi:hypothetical protein